MVNKKINRIKKQHKKKKKQKKCKENTEQIRTDEITYERKKQNNEAIEQ